MNEVLMFNTNLILSAILEYEGLAPVLLLRALLQEVISSEEGILRHSMKTCNLTFSRMGAEAESDAQPRT
jgi:hypothetical protein